MTAGTASHYECYCGNSWESYHTSGGSWCRQCGNEVWPCVYGQSDSTQYSDVDMSSDSYENYDGYDEDYYFEDQKDNELVMCRSFYCTKCSHSWTRRQALDTVQDLDTVQQRCWRCNTMVVPQETVQLCCYGFTMYCSSLTVHYHIKPRDNSDDHATEGPAEHATTL